MTDDMEDFRFVDTFKRNATRPDIIRLCDIALGWFHRIGGSKPIFDRAPYMKSYMRDWRKAQKLGLTVKQYRAQLAAAEMDEIA